MTSDRRCFCGEILVAGTYNGDRGITNLKTGETLAPVDLTCLMGHTQQFWMSHQDAVIALSAIQVVGR